MQLFSGKGEKILVGCILVVAIKLSITGFSRKKQLKREGVYVIGKLYKSDFGGEQGWMYKYRYQFNDRFYFREFNGPRDNPNEKDSLIFFQILPDDPAVCSQVLKPRVPSCLTIEMTPKEGWKDIPVVSCE